MTNFEIIVIGASKGGTRALQTLLGNLPDDFPLPVVIVLHRGKESDEMLVSMLQKSTSLPVSEAEDKEVIVPQHIYLAPPDYHLLIDVGRIAVIDDSRLSIEDCKEPDACAIPQIVNASFALSTDAPVHLARPSIDVLFESAAETYGKGVIGIILTGASRDGSEGLAFIKTRGGLTLVQDPATADSAMMPKAAVEMSRVDRVLPLLEIASFLALTVGLNLKPTS
ncbi:MAG: chemotaxis protein CheB [Planctomycetota bacterium]|nr:chemotaxis protein CheB [Planctomycetota bacterium]